MATYKSNLVVKGLRYRADNEMGARTARGRISFPAGTVLAAGDVLEFAYIGEGQVITDVQVIGIDMGAAAANIGHLQMLDAEGEPLVIDTKGQAAPASTKFTSPESDPDAFGAAVALDGATDLSELGFVVEGPLTVAATVTMGATLASGGEVHLVVRFLGQMAEDGYGGYEYKSPYDL